MRLCFLFEDVSLNGDEADREVDSIKQDGTRHTLQWNSFSCRARSATSGTSTHHQCSCHRWLFIHFLARFEARTVAGNEEEHPQAYVVLQQLGVLYKSDVIKFVETRVAKLKRITDRMEFITAILKNAVLNPFYAFHCLVLTMVLRQCFSSLSRLKRGRD